MIESLGNCIIWLVKIPMRVFTFISKVLSNKLEAALKAGEEKRKDLAEEARIRLKSKELREKKKYSNLRDNLWKQIKHKERNNKKDDLSKREDHIIDRLDKVLKQLESVTIRPARSSSVLTTEELLKIMEEE